MANYGYWLNRMVLFTGWNLSMSQAINPLPFIVQAPRLFAQQISLGDVFQSSTAFDEIHDSLSFFRNAYDSFASYRAAIIRLDGLIDAELARPRVPRVPDRGLGGRHGSRSTASKCALPTVTYLVHSARPAAWIRVTRC